MAAPASSSSELSLNRPAAWLVSTTKSAVAFVRSVIGTVPAAVTAPTVAVTLAAGSRSSLGGAKGSIDHDASPPLELRTWICSTQSTPPTAQPNSVQAGSEDQFEHGSCGGSGYGFGGVGVGGGLGAGAGAGGGGGGGGPGGARGMGFVPGLSTAAFVETCTLSWAVESCVAYFWWKETPRVGVSDGTASYSQQSRPYLWVSLSY